MSDRVSSDDRDREWLAGLLDEPAAAVEELERGAQGAEDESRAEYLQILGMLPLTLDERRPSATLKRRILKAARAAPVAALPVPAPAPGVGRGPRWLLPLAATLALVAVGVAGLQTRRVEELESRIERQAEALATARSAEERMVELEASNSDLRETVAMLTSAGVEFCPLRPPEGSPAQAAWGAMAMSEGGGHWYLRIVGLEPRQDQMQYRLWFLNDGKPMKGARGLQRRAHHSRATRQPQPERSAIAVRQRADADPLGALAVARGGATEEETRPKAVTRE